MSLKTEDDHPPKYLEGNKMRKFIKSKKAELGIMAAIVILLSVMFAAIIGAVIFFSFGEAAHTAQDHTETFNIVDYTTDETLDLRLLPDGTVTVAVYNSSSGNWTAVPSANVSVTRDIVTVGSGALDANSTQLRASYYDAGYAITSNVILYAVIVFGMVALLPLIIIGGIMLRSLGFFSGGGGKAP